MLLAVLVFLFRRWFEQLDWMIVCDNRLSSKSAQSEKRFDCNWTGAFPEIMFADGKAKNTLVPKNCDFPSTSTAFESNLQYLQQHRYGIVVIRRATTATTRLRSKQKSSPAWGGKRWALLGYWTKECWAGGYLCCIRNILLFVFPFFFHRMNIEKLFT